MIITELRPINEGRKSYYGKALVIDTGKEYILQSYQTKVAKVFYKKGRKKKAEVYGTYSNTTTRHIKEFLKQHNFVADNKKCIENLYLVEEKQ